jgi:hypothetical protein
MANLRAAGVVQMSKTMRLSIVVFIGLAICAASNGIAQTQKSAGAPETPPTVKSQNSSQAEDPVNRPEEFAVPLGLFDNQIDAEHTREREKKADRDQADNLQTQRDSAGAAVRSAKVGKGQERAAWWQVGLTAAGTLLLLLSLKYTRDALRLTGIAVTEARRSSDAADAAVRQTAATSQLELRARLSVLPRGINPMSGVDEGIGHVALKNIGKIPAQNVSLHVRMKFSNGDEKEFPVPSDLPIEKRIKRALQPDTEMIEGSQQQMPIIDFTDSTEGKYAYIWGVSYYDDGYGERRTTKFCHRYHTAKANQEWRIRREMPSTQTPRPTEIIPVEQARFHTVGNEAD